MYKKKRIRNFLFVLGLNILLIFLLSRRWGNIPPMGKFLNPFEGFWQNAEKKDSYSSSKKRLKHLRSTVEVVYDEQYVPHIFASDLESLYFLQGYITARHRLWQMEIQTHLAAGRISEIIGRDGLEIDRFQRRRGMVFSAENSFDVTMKNPMLKMMLESYTKGVNAYINHLNYKTYPIEYKLLDYAPEQWTPFKCILLAKHMAATLNSGDDDIEYTNALQKFGREYFDIMYNESTFQDMQDPVIDSSNGWIFKPKEAIKPLNNPTFSGNIIPILPYKKPSPFNGSNNWAISGTKTANGNTILCGDPHLELNLPSTWMAMQLCSPQMNVYGVTLPGTPSVIIGFNDSIAWSFTNARRDVSDWYAVQFKGKNYNQYLLDGKWKSTQKRIEKILIRNDQLFYDTVYYTVWGPVVYDENFRSKKGIANLALRWIAHDGFEEGYIFPMLNSAKNYNDFLQAIQHYSSPAQNIVFADASGNIALWVQGKFPLKWEKQGKFVMDGRFSSNNWQGYIPQEHNIHSYNPEREFVSSANQYPVDTTYPYYIFDTKYESYRNRRINDLLRRSDKLSIEDVIRIQNDNYNLKAAECLPYFLSILDKDKVNEDEKRIVQILQKWDFYNHPESRAATYFESWFDKLMLLLWDELQEEGVSMIYPSAFRTIFLLKERPTFDLMDVQNTPQKETASDIINKSFKQAEAEISLFERHQNSISWAYYKSTIIHHLARIRSLNIKVYNGGNHNIINATTEDHGPSWRMIVELSRDGTKAWGIYPGGQSGNPGSPYYDNFVRKWEKGTYNELLFMRAMNDFSEKILFKQKFIPK